MAIDDVDGVRASPGLESLLPSGLTPKQVCEEARSCVASGNFISHLVPFLSEVFQVMRKQGPREVARMPARGQEIRRILFQARPVPRLQVVSTQAGILAVSPHMFGRFRELGRARVEKYMAQYVYKRQIDDQTLSNSEPVVTLEYQPVYGPAPGYTHGSELGPPIQIKIQKQGGASTGEWRIIQGAY